MPRDIFLLTPTVPDAQDLVNAGVEVDANLGVRSTGKGAVVQLCNDVQEAVLSITFSLKMSSTTEVRRLLPALATVPDLPLYWTEAWAPWGEVGEPGVAIALRLAANLKGTAVVEDGSL